MKVSFLISLHSNGGERIYRDLVSQYSQNRNFYARELAGEKWNATKVVIFGSETKLQACKEVCTFATKVTIRGDNQYVIAGRIKAYIEDNRLVRERNLFYSSAQQDVIYVVNDVIDEDFWGSPQSDSIDTYLSHLMFLDASVSLHVTFGCGPGCTVKCEQCRQQYKKCDVEATKQHACVRSGLCCNSGCSLTFARCQKIELAAHEKKHLPACQTCSAVEGACLTQCYDYSCRKMYCRNSQCECRRAAQATQRTDLITRFLCPNDNCGKHAQTRHALVQHFQHCCSSRISSGVHLPWWKQCPCGIIFLDETHKGEHTTGKKKCKEFVAPQIPVAAPKKVYKDDSVYFTPPIAPPASIATGTSEVFARDLVLLICGAFGTENSPLYTLSPAEMTNIKSVYEKIDDVVRSSRIVAETTGFGSADKGTGVPGFVDVDMLVSINNFDPAKREDYKKIFSELLVGAKATLFECAPDILQIEYEGVDFDLVLVGLKNTENDKRASGFAKARRNAQELRAIIGTDNYVKEVIRAAKYWSKRTFPKDGIKSCLIEAIVLDQYAEQKTELTALSSQRKRRIRLFSLFIAFVTGTPSTTAAQGKQSPSAATVDELLAATPFTESHRAAARRVNELLPQD